MSIEIKIKLPTFLNDRLNKLPNKEEWIQEVLLEASQSLNFSIDNPSQSIDKSYTIFGEKL